MDDQKKKIIAGAIIIALAVALTAFGFYFYAGKKKADSEKQETVQSAKESVKEPPTPTPKQVYNTTGKITEIKAQEGIILIEAQDLSLEYYAEGVHPLIAMTVKVNTDTEIMRGDKKSNLGEFKVGDQISVVASEDIKYKKEFTAKEIIFLTPIGNY